MAEVEKRLGSSPDGLSQAEATKRLAQYGPNEIEEKKTNQFLKLLSYFWGPIPWMIEVAVLLSALAALAGLLHHPRPAVRQRPGRLHGGTLGGQGHRRPEGPAGGEGPGGTGRQVGHAAVARAGAGRRHPHAARRHRARRRPPARRRPGRGGRVGPDRRVVARRAGPGDAVFSGSIIRQGEIGALVYATGANTYFGKTAELVQDAQTASHFQKAVLRIGKFLILLALGMVALITVVSIIRGEPILTTLQFVLVLTVAAIPVAMPTVLSVTMAVGARLLAKKRPSSAAWWPSRSWPAWTCCARTRPARLTQNKLTLGDPFGVGRVPVEEVILSAALASRGRRRRHHRPRRARRAQGRQGTEGLQGGPLPALRPGGQAHRGDRQGPRTATTFKVTKGAPQVILALSANAGQVKAAVDKAVNEFAARGFRSLGVARAEGEGHWQFIGVLPLFDPPRDDAKATIATAVQMGVKVKMVTGDAIAIAEETAKTLGMGTDILDASRHRRREAQGDGGRGQVDRGGRRLRPGVPRAQVPHRRRAAEAAATSSA